ncbi:MAG: hypothetical protein GWN58_05025, partial [Anaerolineae bacterium]|nr:hypothetical protein [Anaerolineae bacterium]
MDTRSQQQKPSAQTESKRQRWRLADIQVDLGKPKHRRNLVLGFVVLTLVGIGALYAAFQA